LSSRLLDGSPAGSESRSRWGRRGHPRPAVLPRRRPPRRLARPPLLSCRQCSVLHGYKAAASSSGPALLLRVKAPPLALVRPHLSARPGAARLARALRVHARSLPAALCWPASSSSLTVIDASGTSAAADGRGEPGFGRARAFLRLRLAHKHEGDALRTYVHSKALSAAVT